MLTQWKYAWEKKTRSARKNEKEKQEKKKKKKKKKEKKGSHYGANTVSHMGTKILELVLKLNKEVSRTNQFRENKKLCSLENCTCHIWNMHIS